jgi:hypothetical protein
LSDDWSPFRERVDGGAQKVNEAKEQKYFNRLMKMRIDHENRQRKILRDRDRNVFIGNVVHQQSDMDMPIARVKELHISDGTTMERQRIVAAERLEREKETRKCKEMKEELAVKSRAEKLVEYKLKEDENKRKSDEKAEIKFMADRCVHECKCTLHCVYIYIIYIIYIYIYIHSQF